MPTLLAALIPLFLAAAPNARDRYETTKAELAARRIEHARALAAAKTAKARAEVVERARRDVLEGITGALVPAWLGTTWSFSGTSTVPGKGTIACGMFVGTLLEDAGFNVDRIALGRLASEHIALSLAGEHNVRRYSDRPAEEVARETVERGEGLYLVGLDFHAGLIWVDGKGDAHFIHSSVWPPGQVVNDPLLGDNPFAYSRYRVVARLLDDAMITRWIRGTRVHLVGGR